MTDFIWGVNTHRQNILSTAQQLDVAAAMGLTSLRVDVYDASPETIAWLSSLVTEGSSRGISILPVIVPAAAAATSEAAARAWGLTTGAALAATFPSLTWEAGNELDTYVIKPGTTGESPSDYDNTLYTIARGAITGISDGIHQADPTAKVAVGITGFHFGFLQRLADDGVDWDITSEHYYSFPGATDIATGADFLFSNLARFNRPILMTEFNQQQGSLLSASTGTLLSMMDAMTALASTYDIIGAYLYELLDEPHLDPSEAHYGLATENGDLKAAGLVVQQYVLEAPPMVTIGLASDTGSSATDFLTSNSIIGGKADPDSIVHLTVDNNTIAQTATANANGDWDLVLTDLADGQHTIVASVTSSGGVTAASSLFFALDTKAPIPVLSNLTISGSLATVIGSTGGSVGETVSLYAGDYLVATATTGNGGGISFSASVAARSVYSYSLVATDAAGNVGVSSGNAYIGSTGADNVKATSQADLIYSASGSDTLSGGSGNDILIGGSGGDTLTGGSEKDVFVYQAASDSTPSASDTIKDFVHGVDKIDFTGIPGIAVVNGVPQFQGKLAGTGNAALNANSIGFMESNGNTVLLVNAGDAAKTVSAANMNLADMKIILVGINLGLTATDFSHS